MAKCLLSPNKKMLAWKSNKCLVRQSIQQQALPRYLRVLRIKEAFSLKSERTRCFQAAAKTLSSSAERTLNNTSLASVVSRTPLQGLIDPFMKKTHPSKLRSYFLMSMNSIKRYPLQRKWFDQSRYFSSQCTWHLVQKISR